MNNYEIKVYAMQRSGHHAVMNWIIGHFNGKIHFINDFSRLRSLKTQSTFYGLSEKEKELELKDHFIKKDALIVNFEEESLEKINKKYIQKRPHYPRGRSKQSVDIIILRDPYNLFASRLKKSRTNPKMLEKWTGEGAKELWISQAKEFLGQTNMVNNSDRKIFINYNKWFLNKKYRIEISKKLGLKFTDKRLLEVPNYGGGSSFDKRSMNSEAQKMNVLGRWEDFADLEYYQNIFTSDIHIYASKIFHDCLDLKKIRSQIVGK